ncbi:MAG: hypothetical protein EXR72_23895 [Myxococcales bacterium]|nr:hypothetical protein [Myxococcales bacterium]
MKHLHANQRMILGRAAVAGAVSLVPVPVLDDLLAGAVRETLLRRIAESRRVDVEQAALALLADVSADGPLDWAIDASTAAALFHRTWRSAALVLRVARRADEFAATFAVATLFDHYCARHHVGLGVDLARARALRGAFDLAAGSARRGLLRRTARRSVDQLLAAPRALVRAVLPPRGGAQGAPDRAEDEAEGGRSSSLVRATAQSPADAWTDELCRAFDEEWKRRA